jgi:vitamin B12/bleomycin/antimicrobial peptide transport system ATP-binding/permease protein
MKTGADRACLHPDDRKRKGQSKPAPVSSMQTFGGLLSAYWRSGNRWEAWGLTAAIMLLTALSSVASVWFAESSGQLVGAIASLQNPTHPTTPAIVLTTAATLIAIVVTKEIGFTALRHFFSATLHRKWRAWLDRRFNDALLDRNHTHFHLQHGAAEGMTAARQAPDNIDQRVQESVKGMTGGAIGLAMGIAGVILSLLFVGGKIVSTSTPVNGLAHLGSYGTACLTVAAVILYVPINTVLAAKLGAMLQNLNIRMQGAEGSYRRALTTLFHRSFHVAATDGERAQRDIHQRLYVDIDSTWAKLNVLTASYMGFELVYSFLGTRIVAYAPGFLPYVHGTISLQEYVTGAELANAIVNDFSWFIHVMPDIAQLRANSLRITSLATAVEDVQRPREFYARSGVSELRYEDQDARRGLTINNLQLMHPGDGEPLLETSHLHVDRGEWALLVGPSGSGKSSMLKAINGLWPHGCGTVLLPREVRVCYAPQDVKLPPLTLKELVCLPERADAYTDREVVAALMDAGLAEFAIDLTAEGRTSQTWDLLLSGGQKQKLVLARILLMRPGLLLLDESTSALDTQAVVTFHEAIRTMCPDVTVISVMHGTSTPKSAGNEEFFSSVLSIRDRIVTKSPLTRARVRSVEDAHLAKIS